MDPLTIGMLGLGAYNAFSSSKKKGQSGVTGPSVVTLPQYSWTAGLRQTGADFTKQQLDRLSSGAMPQYLSQAMPVLRENMSRANKRTYFGDAGLGGGGGILGQIRDTGSALGTGPKATVSRENKALFDYSNAEKGIDEYLTKLGVDITQADARFYTQASQQSVGGPESTVIGGGSYNIPQGTDYGAEAFSSIMGALPYLQGNNTSGGNGGYTTPYNPSGSYPAGYASNMNNQGYNSFGTMQAPSYYSSQNYSSAAPAYSYANSASHQRFIQRGY